MLKIALFPGCFDPFHEQHKNIIEKVLSEFSIDEIWILINKFSNEKKIIAPFIHRFQIIQNLFQDNFKVKIWKKPIGYYTTTLIKKLQKTSSNKKFYLVLGSDQVNQLDQWKNNHNLEKLAQIIAIPRKTFPIKESVKKKYSICSLSNLQVNNFNSKEVKKGLNWFFLNPKTIEYLLNHNIYFQNILKINIQDQNRLKHSYQVAKLAKKIAKKFNMPEEADKLYIAGLLHDLTKTWSKNKHLDFMKKHNLDLAILNRSPYPVWHSYTSAFFLQKELQIQEKQIFSAVFYHTTAKENFDDFSKILFIADKLEPSKKDVFFDKPRKFLNSSNSNLDTLFALTLHFVYLKIKSQNQNPTNDTCLAYQQYCC